MTVTLMKEQGFARVKTLFDMFENMMAMAISKIARWRRHHWQVF